MGNGDDEKCVFPLTSLQIGDLQSYLSDLSVFLALESKKFYILVDNRPWLNPGPRSAQLWQLMVTKSRLSPFANTKGQKEKKTKKDSSPIRSDTMKTKKLEKWFSLINATTLSQKRVPMKKLQSSFLLKNKLQKTLYGFIVFEVAWAHVRGINYLNELQTDTSLAIEAKLMRRWEFDSIDQAAASMSLWFSGTKSERRCLRKYFETAIGEVFYDAEADFSRKGPSNYDENSLNDNLSVQDDSPHHFENAFDVYPSISVDNDGNEPQTPPLTGPYKKRKVIKSISSGVDIDVYQDETLKKLGYSLELSQNHSSDWDNIGEPTEHKDVLILVKFDNRDLPFKLREIIMSDLRLLTLLEAGLPSWVIFLQSYPGFCHLYRPWMCPLARALYVLISFVTVVIGFYDLYKNVPVLKATASSLCGPLFDWIETWDMVSRIKYLGTMLFLHNFQKAVKWTLTMVQATRSFFSVLIMPLVNPVMEVLGLLLPVWNSLAEVMESFCSVIWLVMESSRNLVGDVVEVVLLPIWFLLNLIWNLATTVLYPIIWIIWEVICIPIKTILALANLLAFFFSSVFDVLGDLWRSTSSILQLASDSQAAMATQEVSMWRSLWNDLFSQIFRAVRSILNGFVAFFAACNRHRLSIYNHIQDFVHKLLGHMPRSEALGTRHHVSARDHRHNPVETRQKQHVL